MDFVWIPLCTLIIAIMFIARVFAFRKCLNYEDEDGGGGDFRDDSGAVAGEDNAVEDDRVRDNGGGDDGADQGVEDNVIEEDDENGKDNGDEGGKKDDEDGKKNDEDGKKDYENGKKDYKNGKKDDENGKKDDENGKKDDENGKKDDENGKKDDEDGEEDDDEDDEDDDEYDDDDDDDEDDENYDEDYDENYNEYDEYDDEYDVEDVVEDDVEEEEDYAVEDDFDDGEEDDAVNHDVKDNAAKDNVEDHSVKDCDEDDTVGNEDDAVADGVKDDPVQDDNIQRNDNQLNADGSLANMIENEFHGNGVEIEPQDLENPFQRQCPVPIIYRVAVIFAIVSMIVALPLINCKQVDDVPDCSEFCETQLQEEFCYYSEEVLHYCCVICDQPVEDVNASMKIVNDDFYGMPFLYRHIGRHLEAIFQFFTGQEDKYNVSSETENISYVIVNISVLKNFPIAVDSSKPSTAQPKKQRPLSPIERYWKYCAHERFLFLYVFSFGSLLLTVSTLFLLHILSQWRINE